jgi:hypothetical protein
VKALSEADFRCYAFRIWTDSWAEYDFETGLMSEKEEVCFSDDVAVLEWAVWRGYLQVAVEVEREETLRQLRPETIRCYAWRNATNHWTKLSKSDAVMRLNFNF